MSLIPICGSQTTFRTPAACSNSSSFESRFRYLLYHLVNCPSGSRSVVDSDALTKCQPCKIGAYQPNQGEISCISCNGDLTTVSEGSRSVKNCKGLYIYIIVVFFHSRLLLI